MNDPQVVPPPANPMYTPPDAVNPGAPLMGGPQYGQPVVSPPPMGAFHPHNVSDESQEWSKTILKDMVKSVP